MSRKAAIDWSTLPLEQRQRLIALLSQLVEHQLVRRHGRGERR